MNKTPVLIATPTRKFISVAESTPEHMKKLMLDLQDETLPWAFDYAAIAGGNVARGRNKIVATFLRGPYRWLIFKDDDIVATKEDIVRLLTHRLHVVGALYTTKEPEPHWVLNAFREAAIDPETGILPIAEIGTGLKCYHRTVFEEIIKKEPGLEYKADEDGQQEWGIFCMGMMKVGDRMRWLSEDYWVDQVCWKYNIPVHADTRIKLRHLDGTTSYPLDDKWPALPQPSEQSLPQPPPIAEHFNAIITPGRFVIVLQFWEGDRAQAMRLARFISDLEPVYRDDVLFVFSRRYDTTDDFETVEYVGAKFATARITTQAHATGYPKSPNVMALDAIRYAPRFLDAKCVLLLESDAIPVASDWITQLSEEWDRAITHQKWVLGAWLPLSHPKGHINGNMLFHPKLAVHVDFGEIPDKPWDIHYPDLFAPIWMQTGLILNLYRQIQVSEDRMRTPPCGTKLPVLVHGVKDESAWKYAEKMTRKTVAK